MDLNQLKFERANLPEQIYKVQKNESKALINWKTAKAWHDKEYSFALISIDAKNATEKKAQAIISEDVITAKKKEIETEAEYKLTTAKRKKLERKFEALRSILSLEKTLLDKQ